ncbi:MAG TPA: hypothetical protein VND41_05010 [Nitrososphaerales archaeon]|nr:hypothetical protein [Nitrososphaerales archaeon]
MFLIAVTDGNGVELVGSIRAQYPIQVTIAPATIGNLSHNGTVAFSVNATTFDGFHNIFLSARTGYGITIANQGGENNTVVLTMELFDAAAYAGGTP